MSNTARSVSSISISNPALAPFRVSVRQRAPASIQERFIARIAAELQVPDSKVSATARLLAEGATLPFIARYRKEATGSLDEVAITAVRDRMAQLVELEQRREAILKSLTERNLLSDALKVSIGGADSLASLEDLSAPYRPKRRTRATIAKEAGLEPLADLIFGAPSPVLESWRLDERSVRFPESGQPFV